MKMKSRNIYVKHPQIYASLLDLDHKIKLFVYKFKAMKITRQEETVEHDNKCFHLPSPFKLLGKLEKK